MLTKSKLRTIILDQRKTYQLPKPYIARLLENQILSADHTEITILTGLRRVGKSTLLLKIKESLGGDYFINFDDERLSLFTLEDFQTLYSTFLELFGDQPNFYFDEIQNIKGWEKFVRRLYDMDKRVFITGSNANLLSADLGTHLTGRYIPYTLLPLNFAEFIKLKGITIDPSRLDTYQETILLKAFNNYLETGGIPKHVLHPQSNYLKELVENVIYRDIVTRYRVKHIASLNRLAQYAFSNYSRLISARKLTNVIGVKNHSTVMEYLRYLEDAFLVFLVPKYAYSLKEQFVAPKKLYVIDLAIAREYGFWFSADLGHKLENIVFLHLKGAGKSIFYFKHNSHECDFVVHEHGKIVQAIQVTAELNEDNKSSEISGLLKALAAFKLKEGTIITLEQEDEIHANDHTIKVVPIYKWLLNTAPH